MNNMMRVFACLSTVLVFGCATSPSSESYDSPVGKWTEHWESSSGVTRVSRLTIFDKTSAKYADGYNSRVEFYATEDQRTWKAIWINDGGGATSCLQEKSGSKYWGESIFHFDETFTRYEGTWDFCGQGRKFALRGTR